MRAMSEDRWHQIERIYQEALKITPEKRDSFLEETCRDAPDLKRDVEALLAADSLTFMNRPAWDAVAAPPDSLVRIENLPGEGSDGGAISEASIVDLPVHASATVLASGFELGSYRIEQRMGAGGMGTVYRAIDTRLGRKVAIKVATSHYGERFQREARAISALNHPNICTLHDVGPNYLVMELLDGSTLAEEIRKGPIAPELASQYGVQIAAALAEAHGEGIVHRDLKPGNIMLTRHGVKVLDFGLARMVSEQGLTETSVIMGTPAYMAPEQLKGNEADARTDLFALGLVLYEMVGGRLPFPGASLGSMLAGGTAVSIDPPCKAGTRLASRLNALILGLLKLEPSDRPQSAAAVRQELLELAEPAGKPRRMRYALAAVLAGSLALSAIALRWSYLSNTNSARWPEVSRVSPITTYPGDEAMPAVSNDGAWVAFSWNGKQGGHHDIYVTRSDGLEEPRQLTHDTSEDTTDGYPAWSPDGLQIVFVRMHGASGGEIIVVPAAGGEERKLREVRMLTFPATSWLAWTPDGAQIVFASASLESGKSTLFLMRLADGSVRSLISPPDGVIGDSSPALSPDGRSLAFVRWSSPTTSILLVQKIGAAGQAIGDPVKVPAGTAMQSPAWADNRRLLFVDGQQRIMEWEAGAAAQQIYLSGARLRGLAIAGRDAKGTPRLVTAQRSVPPPRVWTIPLRSAGLAGEPAVPFSRLGNDSENPDFSADGKLLVFASRRTGNPELWTANADGGELRQLTRLGLKSLGVPRWSPDNRHVAFFARTDTEPQIYVIDAIQDQAVPRKVTDEVPGCIVPNWSRDGKFLYCSRRIDGEMRLYRVPAGAGTGQTEMERLFEGKEAKETSDGRVLYIKDDRPGLFARSLTGDPAANPEERLVQDIQGPIAYFALVPEGVYYTGKNSSGYTAIRFFDYARRKTVDVAPKAITGPVNSLTVSPDHSNLVYTQVPASEVDLTLIQF
jgi:serine/threonine protein kinase/Tol biopolymer transport system component